MVSVFDEEDGNPETPLTVSVGDRFQGTLDDKFDEDWIRVDLIEGKTYDITLSGIGPDVDTDTVLRIYNSQGEQVGFHDDVDYAAGKVNSMLSFSRTIPASISSAPAPTGVTRPRTTRAATRWRCMTLTLIIRSS